jgi:hypothetical protein
LVIRSARLPDRVSLRLGGLLRVGYCWKQKRGKPEQDAGHLSKMLDCHADFPR